MTIQTATSESSSLGKALELARATTEKKSENLQILNVGETSGFTDFFVICSAMSDRQVQAIADEVTKTAREKGYSKLTTEGYSDGRWVLIDFGDVVVHIFLDAIREYYNLEGLWEEAKRVPIPKDFYAPSASSIVKS